MPQNTMRSTSKLLLPCTALLLAVVAVLGLAEATRWIGHPFPGFLILGNRVVASAGLEGWPATRDGSLYQHEIAALEGEPASDATALVARVRALPVGTPLTWSFRGARGRFDRTIETRRFGARDFALLFGVYALNGVALGAIALFLCRRREKHPAVDAALPFLIVGACWGLSAMDLYGPWRLFRIHALCEALLFATVLHLALGFPRPAQVLRRHPGLLPAAYAAGLGIALPYQLGLHEPAAYVLCHLLATSALGLSLAALVGFQVTRYWRAKSPEVRVPIRTLAIGTALAVGAPIFLTAAELLTGGSAPQNAVGFTAFLLPIALARALIHTSAALPAKARLENGR